MITMKPYTFWFVTGSQPLYGEETLKEVEVHSKRMVEGLNKSEELPFPITFKEVVTTANNIQNLVRHANTDPTCAGVITWMHTFSPAKNWIAGLKELQAPLLHLHTQYNQNVPWDSIDMDFMNTNQSAHGDREYGFMVSRLNLSRKVVVGHWQNKQVIRKIASWMHTAVAVSEGSTIRVARFGDNMRNVAVTDGDKIEAQIKFGWTVDYYGIGDLVEVMNEIEETEVNKLFKEYQQRYQFPQEAASNSAIGEAIKYQARIELGLKSFLEEGNYNAFTTNFEDLHGMKQLPGLAAQRLMAEGYGFAGEGDWRTAALLRMMKIISQNQDTSFMEDYTYHLEPENEMILGSHMLEVCPTISATKPKVVVQPLGMGGKEAPARLVFDGKGGDAINVSLVEMGGRFRLIINEIKAEQPEKQTPHLPVAKVLWRPQPTLSEATEAWIYAGGAHHTVLSFQVTTEQLYDFADMTNIECIVIDKDTKLRELRNELRWNEAAYRK
ncbi:MULTISPECIES: L-arabinose isomerase [Virgibacillus]|uniref:L-arabinose isomerase n=1 Tax=Virgibacillus kapii TaxID=1638645 RepID=A0ABQ2DX85_9BACI|nr:MULTISPECIES: L-arabinose isomerase [Virgibacillus]EQB35330.1 arabinose isomerase [Virgibacillus sp. CM-4]MYL42644.1 L-arabinose isomerase [Virgibacillus massiliensis]GGJ75711.1 L-arabinose isomerase [Virgibacillus kapii]